MALLSPEQTEWFKARLLIAWAALTAILVVSCVVMALMLRSSSILAGDAAAKDKELQKSNALLAGELKNLQASREKIHTIVLTNTVLLSNSLGAFNENTRRYGSLSNWMSAVRLYQGSN